VSEPPASPAFAPRPFAPPASPRAASPEQLGVPQLAQEGSPQQARGACSACPRSNAGSGRASNQSRAMITIFPRPKRPTITLPPLITFSRSSSRSTSRTAPKIWCSANASRAAPQPMASSHTPTSATLQAAASDASDGGSFAQRRAVVAGLPRPAWGSASGRKPQTADIFLF